MGKKNILIVTRSFYPQYSPRAHRATELAKEFSLLGHNVTILTPKTSVHFEFEKKYNLVIEDLGQLKFKDIQLIGDGVFFNLRRFIRRLLNLFFEYPDIQLVWMIKNKLLKNQRMFDLVLSIATPFPIHWGVAKALRQKNNISKIWIADCGDPYMKSDADTFPKMFYFNYCENMFLKKATFISVPFEEMKYKFNQKYINKFVTIPQGFKMENLKLPQYHQNEIPTFIYAGTVIPGKRDPFSLIEFLLNHKINFQFILYSKEKHHFNKFLNIIGKKIIFKDPIQRNQLIVELSKADFLVNVDMDNYNGVLRAVPTKLIDYYISGRPILSYEQSNLPQETVLKFIKGDYSDAYIDKNIDRYKIEKVALKFLSLKK